MEAVEPVVLASTSVPKTGTQVSSVLPGVGDAEKLEAENVQLSFLELMADNVLPNGMVQHAASLPVLPPAMLFA